MRIPARKTTARATTYRRDQRSGVAARRPHRVRRGRRPSTARPSPSTPPTARRSRAPYARTASAIASGAVEEPLDLALVEVDADDLALELVGDVGVLGR